MDPAVVQAIPAFNFAPAASPASYSVYEYKNELAAVNTTYQTVFAKYIELSESLRGFSPQIGTFEITYRTWKNEADTQVKSLKNALQKTTEIMAKLSLLEKTQTLAEAVSTVSSLSLDLVSIDEEYSQLLEFLDLSHTHRTSVEHHKTLVQECEDIVTSNKPQLLGELFQKAKRAIEDQQLFITKKGDDFKAEITKIHLHLVEFIEFSVKSCQSALHTPQDAALKEPLATLLTEIVQFQKTLQPLTAASFARLNIDTAEKVRLFLDDASTVRLDAYEYFRQGQWHTPVTYFGISDVVSSLTKVKQSIKKLSGMLQERIHELAIDPKKVNAKLNTLTLTQEKAFYEECIIEIERRIAEQRKALYAKPFSRSLHAGINNAAQRESCCYDLRMRLSIFAELSTNPTWLDHPEAVSKLLAYLPPTSIDSSKTPEAIRAILTGVVNVSKLKSAAYTGLARLKPVYEMRSQFLTTLITQIGARVFPESQQTDLAIFEQIIARTSIEQVFGLKEPCEELPARLKEIISKRIVSSLLQKDSKTAATLDLLFFTLTNHSKFKPAYDKTLTKDPLFAKDLELHGWSSGLNDTTILKRLYSIYGAIATSKTLAGNENGQLRRFMCRMLAMQKIIELNTLAELDTLSITGKKHLNALLPVVKAKFSALQAEEGLATEENYLNQYLSFHVKAEDNTLLVDDKPLKENLTFHLLYHLLAATFYGEIEPSLKKKNEVNLSLLLQHVSTQTILTVLASSSSQLEKNLLSLLFMHLAKRLESPQSIPLTVTEYELLATFLTHCFSSEATLDSWMKNCGSCFMVAAAKRFNGLQIPTKSGSNSLFSQKNIGWNYNLFLKLTEAYQLLKTLKPGDKQSADYKAFMVCRDEAKALALKITAPDKNNLVGQLIHLALQKGLVEIEECLTNATPIR